MGKPEELAKAEQLITSAQYDIMAIGVRLSAIERELAGLIAKEMHLVENINILKTRKIIALAKEFKRAKEDLAIIRRKQDIARFDRIQHMQALENAHKSLKHSQESYDILLSRYQNNVVIGIFRRNSGQR